MITNAKLIFERLPRPEGVITKTSLLQKSFTQVLTEEAATLFPKAIFFSHDLKICAY